MLLIRSLSLPSFADFTDSKSGPVRALYVFVQKEQKEKSSHVVVHRMHHRLANGGREEIEKDFFVLQFH